MKTTLKQSEWIKKRLKVLFKVLASVYESVDEFNYWWWTAAYFVLEVNQFLFLLFVLNRP